MQTTTEAFDPKSIIPQQRIGVELFTRMIGQCRVSITTDACSTFVVRLRWQDRGVLQDVRHYYVASLTTEGLALALETSWYRGAMSEESNAFLALRELAGEYANVIWDMETGVCLHDLLNECRPMMAEFVARNTLDDWCQLERTSESLENSALAREREYEIGARRFEIMERNGHSRLDEAKTLLDQLQRSAEAERTLADEYRGNADSAKLAVVACIGMLKDVAPRAELPVPDDFVVDDAIAPRF